jgi:phosphatidate cytidylyltransferase
MTAYFFGFFFGRTQLIRLSPKKTWEGFLGAFVSTFVFAFVFSGFLAKFPYMTCPVNNLSTSAYSQVSCSPNWVFIPKTIDIGATALILIRRLVPSSRFTTLSYLPVQLHALVLAAFASLVAPFGGFFASGFKRAFKIKDFADSIPGHGGITDRMDCQVFFNFNLN